MCHKSSRKGWGMVTMFGRGLGSLGGCSREIMNSLDLIAQSNVEYNKGRSSMQNSMPLPPLRQTINSLG